MNYRCTICDNKVAGVFDFCQSCYHKFQEDIDSKQPWVKLLRANNQREYRRKRKEYNWLRFK